MSQESLWFGIFSFALLILGVGSIVIYYACKKELTEIIENGHTAKRVMPITVSKPVATVEIIIQEQIQE